MPFTLSHPAAVLPLCRITGHPVFMVALVAGSLTPDVGYYLRTFPLAALGHTLAGSVIVCLPAGVALMGGVWLARKPLLWLMQSRVRPVLSRALTFPEICLGPLIVRILFWIWVGALTHILWDSFTHRTGWFVERIVSLRSPLVISENLSFPVFYLLQHTSTIIGLLIVVVASFRICSRQRPDILQRKGDKLRYGFWIALAAVSMVLSAPAAWQHAARYEGLLQFRSFIFQVGILSGGIFTILAVISLMIVGWRIRK